MIIFIKRNVPCLSLNRKFCIIIITNTSILSKVLCFKLFYFEDKFLMILKSLWDFIQDDFERILEITCKLIYHSISSLDD